MFVLRSKSKSAREREIEIESERCKGERVKVLGCKGAKTNITDDRIGARNRK